MADRSQSSTALGRAASPSPHRLGATRHRLAVAAVPPRVGHGRALGAAGVDIPARRAARSKEISGHDSAAAGTPAPAALGCPAPGRDAPAAWPGPRSAPTLAAPTPPCAAGSTPGSPRARLAAVLATCRRPRRRGVESAAVAAARGRLDAGGCWPAGGPGRPRRRGLVLLARPLLQRLERGRRRCGDRRDAVHGRDAAQRGEARCAGATSPIRPTATACSSPCAAARPIRRVR